MGADEGDTAIPNLTEKETVTDVSASIKEHAESGMTHRKLSKLSEVTESLDLIINYTEQNNNVIMPP